MLRWEVCCLSTARFPLSARIRVEVNVEPIRMGKSPESLGEFIRRIRNEKGLSLAAVSKQSARFGPSITPSYIHRIETDPTRKPSANRLRALAYGLGVPAEELLARAAGLVVSIVKSDELHLVTRFRELSPERRADILKLVDLWHSEDSSRRTPRRRSA